jgi:diguanylate cyclase (GGDEF)-like protein/PAS domain S-box-containing protein
MASLITSRNCDPFIYLFVQDRAYPAAGQHRGAFAMKPDEAVAERVYAAERDVAIVRMGVIALNSLVYFLLLDRSLVTQWLALPALSVAWLYGLFVCLVRPYRRFPVFLSSNLTVAADAVLINLWLYATGGFESPFFVLFYISIAAVAYRWNGRDTMLAAAFYSASYILLLIVDGEVAGHWAEITVRLGYVFLVAALGVLLSGEVIDQIRAKVELRKIAAALEDSEERFRRLSEITLEGVTIHEQGIMLDVNHALAAMLGYEEREMIGRSVLDFIAPESREEALAKMSLPPGEPRESVGLRKDGSTFPIEVLARDYYYEGRGVRVASVRDITERVAAERALRVSEGQFRALIENASDFIIIIDRTGVIQYVSPSVTRLMDFKEDEIVGTSGFSWVHPDDLENLTGIFQRRLVEHGVGVPIEFRIRTREGSWRILEAIGNFDLLDSPTLAGVILNARDITDRRQAEETVKRLAYHDVLTGLPNRAFFEDCLRARLSLAEENGDVLGVLFVDVDHFKLVNDSLGHIGGDDLLQIISAELKELMRDGDVVARVGGDEFVVLLSGIKDAEDAVEIARRIVAHLDKRRVIRGRELRVTTSIGISVYPQQGEDADTLIAHADIAMYEAKDRGRNNYRLYSSAMKADVVGRLTLENDLRNGLDRGELEIYYQPIVDAVSERIVAAEALVRWRHPDRGLVCPDEFVPYASESALIVALDEWVLRNACVQASTWRQAGHDIQVTVNLSSRTLQREDLVELVERVLGNASLDPARLVLEITEGAVMSDVESIVVALRRLRAMGVSISVDDFGTGYSSLSYLKRFPINSVKIDRSFVGDVTEDENDAAIVSTIITMAHSLKLLVVAEGVESPEQLAFLKARGCDQLQGYLFARPAPALALDTLMAKGGTREASAT